MKTKTKNRDAYCGNCLMREIIDLLEEALTQLKRFENYDEDLMADVKPKTLAEAVTVANRLKKELDEWGAAHGSLPGYQVIETGDETILLPDS